ncbi:MAG: hypothetical protein ABIE22_03040 [archaeon]
MGVKDYEKTKEALDQMAGLGIGREARQQLVKTSYSCIGRLYGYDVIFEEALKNVQERGLTGGEALEVITGSLNKRDTEIARNLVEVKTYVPFTDFP